MTVYENAAVVVDPATGAAVDFAKSADIATLAKGTHVIVDVDLTVPTSGLVAGDLMADTQQVANLFRAIDAAGVLESVTILDLDDTGDAFDLVFLTDNVSLGTENSAPTISDANALAIVIARVPIATTDWTDLGGVRAATVGNLARVLKPKTGTRDIYIAAIMVTATAQFAGGTVRVRLGMTLD